MTTIGASTAVSISPLLTQEQAQLTQNPPAKSSPQNQEEHLTSKIANGVASVLFGLGCFAAFKSGNSLFENGTVYWENKYSLGLRYWEGQNPLALFNETLAFAVASLALSSLGFIVSKAPKMINSAKDLISSNENRSTAIKIHKENTFPYKNLMVISGLFMPCILGLSNVTLNSFMTPARSMLGMCNVTDVLSAYDSASHQPISIAEFTRYKCEDATRHNTAALKISMIWILALLIKPVLTTAYNASLKNRVEKVDQPTDVQGPKAMPNNQ